MKIPLVEVFIVGVLFVVPSASPRGRQAEKSAAVQGSAYAELARAPEKARAKRNPLEEDPDAAAAGKNLFEQHCLQCHGAGAEGGKKGPSLRTAEVQNAKPGAIFWILTNGVVRKGMPVWSKLPEPQRWQLVSYIKSLGVAPGKPAAIAPLTPQRLDVTALPSPLR